MSGEELEPWTVKACLSLGVCIICSPISWVGSLRSVILSDLIDFIDLHDSKRTVAFSLSDLERMNLFQFLRPFSPLFSFQVEEMEMFVKKTSCL